MRTKRIITKLLVVFAVSAVMIVISIKAGGGGLEPNAPPGPTMHTLEDIYTAVSSGSFSGSQPPPQPLAYDCFMKIDGIPGESVDSKHKDWIDILSYSHGMKYNSATRRVEHSDFGVVKLLDKASPMLALFCCKVDGIKQVEIEIFDPNRVSYRIMRYILGEVVVTEVKQGTPMHGNIIEGAVAYPVPQTEVLLRPLEEVSFKYATIDWIYTTPRGDTVQAGWDVAKNMPR